MMNSPEPTEATTGFYAIDDRPRWKIILCRLFSHHPMLPDLPDWAKDGLVTTVRINFSFRDRLLVLLTGNASVRAWSACENPPGRVETDSHAMADRPKFLDT